MTTTASPLQSLKQSLQDSLSPELVDNLSQEQKSLLLSHLKNILHLEEASDANTASSCTEDHEHSSEFHNASNSKDDKDHSSLHAPIIQFIKSSLPPPYDPSVQKQIRFPGASSTSFTTYSPQNTIEMDAYLYDDNEIDNWVDSGLLSRHYCASCHSRQVEWLNMISHSMSAYKLHHLVLVMNQILHCDKKESVLIDVGSRLGAVLWESYYNLEHVNKLIGVEIDDKFVNLQTKVIEKFNLNNHSQKQIQIIHDDVLNQKKLFLDTKERLIVVFHNVFEWFVNDNEGHQNAWKRMREYLSKPGTIIISSPPLKQSLKDAQMADSDAFVDQWVDNIFEMEIGEQDDDEEAEGDLISFYQVK